MMLCQTTALKMSASRPSWLVAAVATDALRGDHLAHDAARAVGRGEQHLGLAHVEMGEDAGPVDLRGRDLLQAAKQSVAAGVGPSQKDAEPAQQRCEKRVQYARVGKSDPERRVHPRVARNVAQTKHE